MTSADGAEPTHIFDDGEAWQAWLAHNHETASGVWLKIAKKGSGAPGVSITEALDVALCYGWIDGQRRRLDDRYYLQRYSPRRPTSPWSQLNVEKVAALSAGGRMRPPGLAAVEAARRDGRWPAAT